MTLQGIVTDWSVAEICSLKIAVGEIWLRDYRKVAKCTGSDHVNMTATEKELSTEQRKDVLPNCFKYSDS